MENWEQKYTTPTGTIKRLILTLEGDSRSIAILRFHGTVNLADFETEFGSNLASESMDWTLKAGLGPCVCNLKFQKQGPAWLKLTVPPQQHLPAGAISYNG